MVIGAIFDSIYNNIYKYLRPKSLNNSLRGDFMDNCCEGYCRKCHGMIWGLIGILILINVFVWPRWSGIDGWMAFLGLLLVLGGIWKSVMSGCSCHHEGADKCTPKAESVAPAKEAKKKK
jgi:hypothetical protein